jgi:RNA polymerase sigma-70 factor (ECF subfamily)
LSPPANALASDVSVNEINGLALRGLYGRANSPPTAVGRTFVSDWSVLVRELHGVASLPIATRTWISMGSGSSSLASSLQATALTDLHLRFVEGDRMAVEAIADRVLPVLTTRLRRAFPRQPIDVLHDALTDAFLDYMTRPRAFDSSSDEALQRRPYQAAWRNAANSLRSEERRRKRQARYPVKMSVATPPSERMNDPGVSMTKSQANRILEVANTAIEREALVCWLSGQRRTSPLARALSLGELSQPEQRREVKRFKDRILKRVARLGLTLRRGPE